VNQVPIQLLKPHPKNKEYYPDTLPENLWNELVRDIRENGVINPLIITPDYTVLAGHLRLEAAQQAGLTHVPVVIRDVDPDSDEAVELFIKDNLLRRQLNDMQVARLVRALKEKHGVKRGRPNNGNNNIIKQDKMSELIGLNEKQLRRLDKLNDLIPELQSLIESGKLGTTAAYELAFLTPETQKQLLAVYGESISDLKQFETKELRKKIEEKEQLEKELEKAQVTAKEMESRAIEAEDELHEVKMELSSLQEKLNEVIEDARKEERKAAEEKIHELEEKISRLGKKIESSRQAKEQAEAKVREIQENYKKAHQAVEEKLRKDIADRDNRIKLLQEQIVELNKKIAELESRPPEVIEKVPDDYEALKQTIKTLKKEKEQAESELLGLTREQIEQKDRYWVRDIITKMSQDMGRYIIKLRYEMGRRSMDAVAYKDIMDCADLLTKIAGELRDMASLEKKAGGDYIEIVV
jgi:ParB family chromosome partitioning protein